MQRCRVLVINDYAKMGGAEVVYQQSADLLATLPNVDVEKLCERLTTKYDTAVVSGRFFESPQHIRIGLCCEPVNFTAGIKRLGDALDELQNTASFS